MLARIAVLALAALSLAPSTLADSHNLRNKRDRRHRHAEVAERNHVVEERSANATHTHAKRFTGRGTFYYTGLGACGQYSKDSDYMVALNTDQYGSGYPGPNCFKTITISSNGVTIGGVTILDECPTCPYGALDLSPSLFDQFHSSNGGTLDLTWWFEDGSSQQTTSSSTWVEPSTTSTWVAPTSTWVEPTTTSTWSPPPTSTSTWVAPSSTSTSTSTTPTSTSTWSSAAWSSAAPSSTSSTVSTTATSAAASGTSSANPYVKVAAQASATSGAASPSGTSPSGGVVADVDGNLVAINGLVANYGQMIVTGAGGSKK